MRHLFLSVLVVIGLIFPWTVAPANSQAAIPNPAKVAAMEADEYGLKNAKAIGQSIAPFYGQAAADKFATLRGED